MEQKQLNSLNEAALQVQLGESLYGGHSSIPLKKDRVENQLKPKPETPETPKKLEDTTKTNKKEQQESVELALEYFDVYFGETLNEDTSDEDIMESVYDLIDLTEAVLEAVGLNENLGWHKDTQDDSEKEHRGIFDNSGDQRLTKIIGNLFRRKKKKSTESPDPKWVTDLRDAQKHPGLGLHR